MLSSSRNMPSSPSAAAAASSFTKSMPFPTGSAGASTLGVSIGQKTQPEASFVKAKPSYLKSTASGAQNSMHASRRGGSKTNKKRDEKARIIFDNRDATPRPLGALAPAPAPSEKSEAALLPTIPRSSSIGESATVQDAEGQTVQGSTEGWISGEYVPESAVGADDSLDARLAVKIEETETIMLLNIPSIRVFAEDVDARNKVVSQNDAYNQLLEDHKTKDKFVHRPAQTFNNPQREKEMQTSAAETESVGVGVSTWELFDAYALASLEDDPESLPLAAQDHVSHADEEKSAPASGGTNSSSNRVLASSANNNRSALVSQSSYAQPYLSTADGSRMHSSYSSNGDAGTGPHALAQIGQAYGGKSEWDRVANTPQFQNALHIVECAIVQSAIHEQQKLYRDLKRHDDTKRDHENAGEYQDVASPASHAAARALAPSLTRLWSYNCKATAGFSVTCMDWNKQNKDLLAVGYGQLHFGKQGTGLICFWSLRNPKHPEKIVQTKHSVTSLDFSAETSHLLAVGLYNGDISIYDVRSDDDQPWVQSTHSSGKHAEAVWGVKWVQHGSGDGTQALTSISSDGTVKQWSMKKGLVPHEIMQLKRVPNTAQFHSSHLDGLSRQASALCFDFIPNDPTQYVAGTEDGLIHKCSVSYNEQTLENFYGHTGPVYKVRCSPFLPDAFLSCSADWTASLWSQRSSKPVLTFKSGHDYVMDARWSPTNPCVFCCVTRDGRVEVWDIEKSPLDPIIPHRAKAGVQLTSAAFSTTSPVLLVGDNDGNIEVYRVNGINLTKTGTPEEQSQRLLDAIYEHSANEQATEQKININYNQ